MYSLFYCFPRMFTYAKQTSRNTGTFTLQLKFFELNFPTGYSFNIVLGFQEYSKVFCAYFPALSLSLVFDHFHCFLTLCVIFGHFKSFFATKRWQPDARLATFFCYIYTFLFINKEYRIFHTQH